MYANYVKVSINTRGILSYGNKGFAFDEDKILEQFTLPTREIGVKIWI